ncbi:NADP-dependent oxidoreductase [Conexibacter arvalis]|uniref:NADPH:quinone reductase-like Zn-dependent oxidoreductase n=1 Tax=Conexibacter arvalis TaxID=912552 RepID=A0A840IHJ6_9ACTN|nr:NADP-dependent oxidoreductase [Conexibacter arvalis]MBB4664249.1 NADPH:quinone reductase-like Zn-dependent oxidoreductase [Conexibacter arvalis]
MRSARIHRHGDPSVIRIDDLPRPVPGPGELLVRVAATSFNPSEAALRAGWLRDVIATRLPYALGWDVAGTVEALGAGAGGRFSVGDRVVGRLDAGGAAAEYVAASAELFAAAPSSIPLEAAAALPVAGLTAWQAVVEHGRVAARERVLVNGAGGGVGGFVVQLAKRRGAHVIATASPRSADAVRGQGADELVDYTAVAVADAVRGPVDVLLNLAPIDPAAAAALVALVRPGGRAVSIATPVETPRGAGVETTHFVARNDRAQLAELVALVDAGALAVDWAESLPLSELAEVHRRSEAGELRGKVVLVP